MQIKSKGGVNPTYKVVDNQKCVEANFFFSSNEIPDDLKENYVSTRVMRDSMINGSINDTPVGAYILGKRIELKENYDGIYGYMVLTKLGYTFFCDLESYDGCLLVRYRNKDFEKQYGIVKLKIGDIVGIFEIIKRQF